MRVTCQRCGAQIFLKQTGYNTIDAAMVNRHSFYDKFEPMPNGWEINHIAHGWLCPQCIEQFSKIFNEYMQSANAFMQGGHTDDQSTT